MAQIHLEDPQPKEPASPPYQAVLQLGASKSLYKALSWPTILPEDSLWKLSKGLQERGISLWPDRSTSFY